MFYVPISVREAVKNINQTWFLPAVQRPYDWGERSKKKEFIYSLFDSLSRRYPIGTMIIWRTRKRIPYRDFLTDYDSEKLSRIKDKGLWAKKDKHLIYDGQQRMQSLYSCLNYTFHGEILCYDLEFDLDKNPKANGFKFFSKNEDVAPRYLRLNELFLSDRRQRSEYEDKVLERLPDVTAESKKVIRKNLSNLWAIFVEDDAKLLSYFPLEEDLTEDEVLDVFKRINTTGMQLSKSEILFSDIKNVQFDFEESIWDYCLIIKKATDGFSVSPDFVLQVLFLLVKGASRVDPERVERPERKAFISTWGKLQSPLVSFYSDFLYKEFKMNHESIIPLKTPLIPLISYFYHMRVEHDRKYKDFSQDAILNMKRYLIMSQLLQWDLQSYVDRFNQLIKEEVANSSHANFPFDKVRKIVRKDDKRYADLRAEEDFGFDQYSMFSLKVLIPKREYQYIGNKHERFDPEIDHIFPTHPQVDKIPGNYSEMTQKVWNLQPVKGGINGTKLATPPRMFFLKYPKYLSEYDFLPSTRMSNNLWAEKNIKKFVNARKRLMMSFARKE